MGHAAAGRNRPCETFPPDPALGRRLAVVRIGDSGDVPEWPYHDGQREERRCKQQEDKGEDDQLVFQAGGVSVLQRDQTR